MAKHNIIFFLDFAQNLGRSSNTFLQAYNKKKCY